MRGFRINASLEPRIRAYIGGTVYTIVPEQYPTAQGGMMACPKVHEDCKWVLPGGEVLSYDDLMARLLRLGAKAEHYGGRLAA